MIGLDTSFLIAFEIKEHERHGAARSLARERSAEGFAISSQILAEFLNIVTDPRRFERPLSMEEAISRISDWWQAKEVRVILAGESAGSRFLDLLRRHQPGRKQLLDTLLASTYLEAGVNVVATTNARDFAPFEGMGTVLV